LHVGWRFTASSRGRPSSCCTARILLGREGHLRRASRGRRDQRLQERLNLEPLDPRQRLDLVSRQGALATIQPHRLVEGLRPSVVQFVRPITLPTTSSSRVGVLCEYFATFSFSRLGGGGLEDRGGHVGLDLEGKGGRQGIGLGGSLAVVDVRQEFPASDPSQVLPEP
jgi:hypothetical protein